MEDRINKPIYEITVDDGSVKVPIRNKFGDEIGEFYFTPTDTGIVNRFDEVAEKVGEIIAPLEHVNINPDGTADSNDIQGTKALKEATTRLYEAVDYLFGGNMSGAFFGKTNPFSPVNGAFYFENALEVVGTFINSQFDREMKKVNDRMNQYTQGYTNAPNRAQRRKNKRRNNKRRR